MGRFAKDTVRGPIKPPVKPRLENKRGLRRPQEFSEISGLFLIPASLAARRAAAILGGSAAPRGGGKRAGVPLKHAPFLECPAANPNARATSGRAGFPLAFMAHTRKSMEWGPGILAYGYSPIATRGRFL